MKYSYFFIDFNFLLLLFTSFSLADSPFWNAVKCIVIWYDFKCSHFGLYGSLLGQGFMVFHRSSMFCFHYHAILGALYTFFFMTKAYCLVSMSLCILCSFSSYWILALFLPVLSCRDGLGVISCFSLFCHRKFPFSFRYESGIHKYGLTDVTLRTWNAPFRVFWILVLLLKTQLLTFHRGHWVIEQIQLFSFMPFAPLLPKPGLTTYMVEIETCGKLKLKKIEMQEKNPLPSKKWLKQVGES